MISKINIFKAMKKSKKTHYNVSERDPVFKVKYLGNVQTTFMKGEGCVDKPTNILWNNFVKNGQKGKEMELQICSVGLKAITIEHGVTDYSAHRISYIIAHPDFPRLFVWVYRHEAKRLKIELRCHAVICKTRTKARALALLLAERLENSLREFKREKMRRQNKRLTLERTDSFSLETLEPPARKKFLSTAQNYKPALQTSSSAPKLGAIREDMEEDEEEEEDVVEDLLADDDMLVHLDDDMIAAADDAFSCVQEQPLPEALNHNDDDLVNHFVLGNDLDELRRDESVQKQINKESDEESSESGFSEAENQTNGDYKS